MGQKYRWHKIWRNFIAPTKETVFVDLFGGSGLLSHWTSLYKPDARVIWNDFDDYAYRLTPEAIDLLNGFNNELTGILNQFPDELTEGGRCLYYGREHDAFEQVNESIKRYIKMGGNDVMTISVIVDQLSRTATKDFNGILKMTPRFTKIRKAPFPCCSDYLDGIERVQMDWLELFEIHKDNPDAFFIADPPYKGTDTGSYAGDGIDHEKLAKSLSGKKFAFFTSDKSDADIPEHDGLREMRVGLANNTTYRDLMYFTS